MKTNADTSRSMDDLIFENRNHEYGAYVIRRTYPDNVNKGAMLSIGVVAIVTIISILPKQMLPAVPTHRTPVLTTGIIQPPTIITIQPPSHAVAPLKGSANLAPVAVVHQVVETTLPNQDLNPGIDEGVEFGDPNIVEVIPATPTELGPALIVEDTKVWERVEVMPQYIGGLSAMMHYIVGHVKYPARARRGEKEGTVFVSFVIGKDGSVLDPKVVKGFDQDCDQEAIKVMMKMPQWKPGIQSGVPVMVRMVIPIKFKLNT